MRPFVYRTLLYVSRSHCGLDGAVELSGDVALEGAADLAARLAFCGAAFDVGAGAWAVTHADDRDGVDRAVQCAVGAAVESMTGDLSAAGRQWFGSGQGGDGGVAADAAGMGV